MIEPITEIRALLLQFEKSGLRDFYVRTGDWRVFMARPGGGPNPMLQTPSAPEPASLTAPALRIQAPHLGLYEPACAAGDEVAEGALIGRLDVLGRKTYVLAERAGRVVAVNFTANDLVEYGETLVEIAPS